MQTQYITAHNVHTFSQCLHCENELYFINKLTIYCNGYTQYQPLHSICDGNHSISPLYRPGLIYHSSGDQITYILSGIMYQSIVEETTLKL